MKKTVTKQHPVQIPDEVDLVFKQALCVPQNGSLEPDPAIRNRIVAKMETQQKERFHPLRALANLFPVRAPIYQAAFAMAIVFFAVLGTHRKTQPINTTEMNPESPAAVADTSQTQRDTPRTSTSDTLAQSPIVQILSAGSPIDSL